MQAEATPPRTVSALNDLTRCRGCTHKAGDGRFVVVRVGVRAGAPLWRDEMGGHAFDEDARDCGIGPNAASKGYANRTTEEERWRTLRDGEGS